MLKETFYRPPQSAKVTGIHAETVRGWITEGHPVAGKLKASNVGKGRRPRWIIWGPDFNAFLNRTNPQTARRTRKRKKKTEAASEEFV